MDEGAGSPLPLDPAVPVPGAASPASEAPEFVRVRPRLDPRLEVQAHGGALYRGGLPGAWRPNGTKVSQAKRFAVRMRKLAMNRQTETALRSILCDPDHDQFMRALEFVTERAFGRVPQKVEAEHTHRHAVVLLPTLDADPVREPVAVIPSPVPPSVDALPATVDPTAAPDVGRANTLPTDTSASPDDR